MTQHNVIPIIKAIELKKRREKKEEFERAQRSILAQAAKLNW